MATMSEAGRDFAAGHKGEPWTFLVRESLRPAWRFCAVSVLSDQLQQLALARSESPISKSCGGEALPLGSPCAHSLARGEGQPGLWSEAGGSRAGRLRWPDLVPLRVDATQSGGSETFDSLTDLVEHFKRTDRGGLRRLPTCGR